MSAGSTLRVRAFAPYPETGPSTRFRLLQFVEPLAAKGIALEIVPFLEEGEYRGLYEPGGWLRKLGLLVRGLRRRFRSVTQVHRADVVLIQRELAPVLNVRLLARAGAGGVPLVYDFDDAVFLPPPGGSRLMALFRRPEGATAAFSRRAARILAGNRYLAEFARAARDPERTEEGARASEQAPTGRPEGRGRDVGPEVRILPTVIDTDRFVPRADRVDPRDGPPVVGWIGTHSTNRYLADLYPALQRLADRSPYRLLVVSNRPPPPAPALELEYRPWRSDREVAQVQALDVGLYPLSDGPWARGKCGFKAIQYLACGVPTVASPVGVLRDIVLPGATGYLADEPEEWVRHLERLLTDRDHRRELGRRGREHVVERYSVRAAVGVLETAIREAAALRSGVGASHGRAD